MHALLILSYFLGGGCWQNFWILQNCRWWLCVKHHSWWMIPMLGFYFHQMLLQKLRSTSQWTQAVWVCWSLFKTVSLPIENMLFITQIHNSGFCPLNSLCYTWAGTLLYIWSLYIFLLHICLHSIKSLVLQLPVGEFPVPHELEAGVTIQFSQVMVQMWWSTFAGQGHTVTQEEFLEFGKRLLISF